jgi:hypothetical protein
MNDARNNIRRIIGLWEDRPPESLTVGEVGQYLFSAIVGFKFLMLGGALSIDMA